MVMDGKIFEILAASDDFLRGKRDCFTLCFSAMLAGSNVLIEDLPGVGKTTMVKYLGKCLGLNFSRVQFTNDLLPSDILGTSIFDQAKGEFRFHPGPIFGEIILADELNRAPPKTQSALLQAMEERKVTIDGNTHNLPEVFTVFATQNPMGQLGTFPLPESQLDRFAIKFEIGQMDEEATVELLKTSQIQVKLEAVQSGLNATEVLKLRKIVGDLHVTDDLYKYIYRLLAKSRSLPGFLPLSNRCGLDLVKLAKAHAFLNKRDYVIPDDIQFLFPYVVGHRLSNQGGHHIATERSLANQILERVALR